MLRIAFVHPDLGIGGAERLVLDAALALLAEGHEVCIFTSGLDAGRSFPEARDGSLEVRVHGGWLPADIAGRLRAPSNMLRTSVAAVAALRWKPDLFLCDSLAHLVPLLRLGRRPVLFYGHYPDLLLTGERKGWYGLYRAPIDALEAAGTRAADRLVVNSLFTADAFTTLPGGDGLHPILLPPSVSCPDDFEPMPDGDDARIVIASINRFDPRKNLSLAVEAYAALRSRIDAALFARTRLVLAGGLDKRLPEQVRETDDLRRLAATLGLSQQIELRASITDAERHGLLASARVVLYTPAREHFGIVPLEAMAAARPVVASRTGGPCETVIDGVTGFLCDAAPDAFAGALAALVSNVALAQRMGEAGRERCLASFSRAVFQERLAAVVRDMMASRE